MGYRPEKFEKKWQDAWDSKRVFATEQKSTKPKYYILDMFPYPSSTGLHVGHPEGYTATDILARYKRTKGFNVLHPMGWDAFGLPAEQFALKTGVHPAVTTQDAIENFRRQLKSIGFSFDWSREISTASPDYYKWTQKIFLELFNRGLAYRKEVAVNWCPALKTVLANEEVVDGKSERGGHPVQRRPMMQWMLKITAYAERLLKDLDGLDWPESTKELQRHWIGKSEGLEFSFSLDHPSRFSMESGSKLTVFTTRPDTVYGVTFMVIAPEHPYVRKFTSDPANSQRDEVSAYVEAASRKSELMRQDDSKEKSGVFSGAYAVNPFSGEKVPIWIADYVLMTYGTGAIMAVPGHDERDHAFAKCFQLPIRQVVKATSSNGSDGANDTESVYSGDGISVNSELINGLATNAAIEKIILESETRGIGSRKVNYKLRDWLFSRQRYWGEPFPIAYEIKDGKVNPNPLPVDASALPVTLPSVTSYEPTGTGESPLAAITDWVNMPGGQLRRETDTMPGSAGSSWYFLRYCDPHNTDEPWSKESEKYFMPVDLYLGGPEHAVGHLLYSRFWTKVLYDAGMVSHDEPFKRLVHQGMILGEDGEKMSKSRGNVINPDEVIKKYGADTLRLYEMFMGPLEKDKPWSTTAIEGVYRFLQRAYRVFYEDADPTDLNSTKPDILRVKDTAVTDEDLKVLHKTIQKVGEDIEALRFNTAISHMMVFINHFTKTDQSPRACLKPFIQLLAPFAPHLAEELWHSIGETSELSFETWPIFDQKYVTVDSITMAIQVLGKTRGTIDVPVDADQAMCESLAFQVENVKRALQDKTVRKVIFVKNKILNIVC